LRRSNLEALQKPVKASSLPQPVEPTFGPNTSLRKSFEVTTRQRYVIELFKEADSGKATGKVGGNNFTVTKSRGWVAGKRPLLTCAVAVFLVAAGVRITFLALRGPVLTPDSVDYVRLASNIRAHGAFSLDLEPPFSPTIRRAPLYPALLAILPVSIGKLPIWASGFQLLLDSGVAVMVLLVASASLSLRWATGAGIAYAVFPGAIYFSTNVLSEPLFTFFLVGGVLAAVNGLRSGRGKLTAVGGILLGLATLCRPVALPLPVLLVGVCLLQRGSPQRWAHYFLLIGCAALVILPWSVRSTVVSNHVVLVQGIAPALFYAATRTDWDQQDQESLWLRFGRESEYGRRLGAARTAAEIAEADRLGLHLAIENVRSNPRAYFVSRVKSFPYLFITSFDTFTRINSSFRTLWLQGDFAKLAVKVVLMLLFAVAPFVLALIGLVPSRRDLSAMLVATVWLYTLAANLPMWVEYRFWVPVVPFMLVSAAIGACQLSAWLTARKNGRRELVMTEGRVRAGQALEQRSHPRTGVPTIFELLVPDEFLKGPFDMIRVASLSCHQNVPRLPLATEVRFLKHCH
jgi:hypothetical protein